MTNFSVVLHKEEKGKWEYKLWKSVAFSLGRFNLDFDQKWMNND